jgi:hypothetical protein
VIAGTGVNGSVGICAFSQSGIRVVYGNTVFRTQHLTYFQNTAPQELFVVGNTFIEPDGEINNQRAIHAYTESANKGEKMRFINNVISGGQALIGGQANSTPYLLIEYLKNLNYKADFSGGYKRPIELKFEENILLKSKLDLGMFWGEGERQYIAGILDPNGNPYCTGESCLSECSTIKSNVFFNPGQIQLNIKTAAYYPPGTRNEGLPKLRACDVCDLNDYRGGFRNAAHANNENHVLLQPLDFWKNKTQTMGNRLDNNSTSTNANPDDGFKVILNEYDPTRGTLAVWNFSGSPTVNISLPFNATLHPIKTPYGAPIANVPMGAFAFNQSSEFEVYHFRASSTPDPDPEECDLATAYALAVKIMQDRLDPLTTHQIKVRRMGKTDLQLIECLESIK